MKHGDSTTKQLVTEDSHVQPIGVRYEASAHSVQTVPVSHKLQGDGHLGLASGSHRQRRPGKMEGQQMAMGPAAKSLVAISTNVAGTVLIITLEVACCI